MPVPVAKAALVAAKTVADIVVVVVGEDAEAAGARMRVSVESSLLVSKRDEGDVPREQPSCRSTCDELPVNDAGDVRCPSQLEVT